MKSIVLCLLLAATAQAQPATDRAARERAARERITARAAQRAAQRRGEAVGQSSLSADAWASPAQFSYPGAAGASPGRSVYTCSPMPSLGQ